MSVHPDLLLVVRDVLVEHMDSTGALPEYRVRDVVLLDASGDAMDEDDVHDQRPLVGLLLQMRDGTEVRLIAEEKTS